jgi:hypothetical protein
VKRNLRPIFQKSYPNTNLRNPHFGAVFAVFEDYWLNQTKNRVRIHNEHGRVRHSLHLTFGVQIFDSQASTLP